MQYNTQQCSDELIHFLNSGNGRRLYNVLGDACYPWETWFLDVLAGRNASIKPQADLQASLAAHPDVASLFSHLLQNAARHLLFSQPARTPNDWQEWSFLAELTAPDGEREAWLNGLSSYALPTWFVMAAGDGSANGVYIRVGLHVDWSCDGCDQFADDVQRLRPALVRSAEHVRRGHPGNVKPWFTASVWHPRDVPKFHECRGSSFAAGLAAASRFFTPDIDIASRETAVAKWRQCTISADIHEDGNQLTAVGALDGKFAAFTAADANGDRPSTLIVSDSVALPERRGVHDLSVITARTVNDVIGYLSSDDHTPAAARSDEHMQLAQFVKRTQTHLHNTYPDNTVLSVLNIQRSQLKERVREETLQRGPGVVLQGGMGMGKSVLLCDLVNDYCGLVLKNGRDGAHQPDLPLFFSAAEFSQSVADLVASRLDLQEENVAEHLNQMRKQGMFRQLILVIDGLNEINYDDELVSELVAFSSECPDGAEWVRVIVTCRPERAAAWQSRPQFFTSVIDVGPFSDEELDHCFRQLQEDGVQFPLHLVPPVTREAIKTPLMHTLFHRIYQGCEPHDLPVNPPLAIPLQFCRAFIERLGQDSSRTYKNLKTWASMLDQQGRMYLTRSDCSRLGGRQGMGAFDYLSRHGCLVPAEHAGMDGDDALQLLHPGISAYLLYEFCLSSHALEEPETVVAAMKENPLLHEAAIYVIQNWLEQNAWGRLIRFLKFEQADIAQYLNILTPYLDKIEQDAFWLLLAEFYHDAALDTKLEFELWERLTLRGKGARAGRTAFWQEILRRSDTPAERLRCLSILCRSGLLPDTSFSMAYCDELHRLLESGDFPLAYRVVGRYVMADMVSYRPRATTPWQPDVLLDEVAGLLQQIGTDDWREVLPKRVHNHAFLTRYDRYVRGYFDETMGKVVRRMMGSSPEIERHYQRANAFFLESCRLPALRTVAQNGISRVAHNQITYFHYHGEFGEAMAAAASRFDIALRSHNLDDCATSLTNFANLLVSLGAYDLAYQVILEAARLNRNSHNYRGVILSLVHGMHAALVHGVGHAQSGYAYVNWDNHIRHMLFDFHPAPWDNLAHFKRDALYESRLWGTMTWLHLLIQPPAYGEALENCRWRMLAGDFSVEDVINDSADVTMHILNSDIETESFLSPLTYLAAYMAADRIGMDVQPYIPRLEPVISCHYPATARRCRRLLASAGSTPIPFLDDVANQYALPSATPMRHYQMHAEEILRQLRLTWPH